MTVIVVFTILFFLCLLWVLKLHNQFETFESQFSPVNEDISNGNAISMSNRPNPYIYVNQKGQRNPIIYQGHGIPLIHEDHPTAPIEKPMFYFTDYQCSPECCQYSSDSCTNGCVCRGVQPQAYLFQNKHITPQS
jgi:hypothetical protein